MAVAPERNKHISALNKAYSEKCSAHLTKMPERFFYMGHWWRKEEECSTPDTNPYLCKNL